MEEVDRLIRDAIENGQRITVIYFGGTTPGQARDIEPISLSGDKLRALCVASQMIKSFSLSKIRASPNNEPPPTYATPSHSDTYTSFEEFSARYLPELQGQGIAVSAGNHFLYVHHRLKNGKPRKSVAVGIKYERTISDLIFNEITGEVVSEERERTRPWIVINAAGNSRLFKDAAAAQVAFLTLVREIQATP